MPYKTNELAVNVTKLFWFNYQDYEDDFSVGSWGIVDIEGKPKEAYDVMKELLSK